VGSLMPYVDKYQRPMLESLIRAYKQYPSWKEPESNAKILRMIDGWLQIITKDNPSKIDGYVNFMCTTILKHTHRTYHIRKEKQIYNSLDKEVAHFIRQMFWMIFEVPAPSYAKYERLYGLLSLMEVEFERRGWSLGRPDIKTFFVKEKHYWRKRIAEYEDLKLKENGDVD